MNLKNLLSIIIVALFFVLPATFEAEAGMVFKPPCKSCQLNQSGTDSDPFQLYAFFDLRDRESYFQVTNINNEDGSFFNQNITVHVQIFNVGQNCNENNFFDVYTPNDTHVYNLRDILTNDGNPSGVVLPENSYGIVVVSQVESIGGEIATEGGGSIVGNFRVLDDLGYEYRTNAAGISNIFQQSQFLTLSDSYTFNFNTVGGVSLSDVVGIQVANIFNEPEVDISDITQNNVVFDINIYDLNEVPFSCRNIIYACTDQDNPLLEELLAGDDDDDFIEDASANVASFEYGINNAIPHSKGSELLCPGNIISEGFVTLRPIGVGQGSEVSFFVGYAGLNNGNGRGSMDSFWAPGAIFEE